MSHLSLMINAAGAWSTIVAVYFGVNGANQSDCITVAITGLAMSAVGVIGLWLSEPEVFA